MVKWFAWPTGWDGKNLPQLVNTLREAEKKGGRNRGSERHRNGRWGFRGGVAYLCHFFHIPVSWPIQPSHPLVLSDFPSVSRSRGSPSWQHWGADPIHVPNKGPLSPEELRAGIPLRLFSRVPHSRWPWVLLFSGACQRALEHLCCFQSVLKLLKGEMCARTFNVRWVHVLKNTLFL